ncbi:MAG: type IV toxin-antitoxin system AbiEi family antitoxin domain-containing protein [Clostridiales bacterium]|jgi:hypothetical protein|nr:type IV toxin-antitoxin system AbiEi family antitoxin domain-containing protein [Clostridiales bacterium]
MATDTTKRIKERIAELEDKVFITKDFLDIAGYSTVSRFLNRLTLKGTITRIMPGMYCCPCSVERFNRPSVPLIVDALARKFNWHTSNIDPTALNPSKVSTQAMPNWTFVSTGKPAVVQHGNSKIEFKHCRESELIDVDDKNALVIQAIRTLGKNSDDKRAKQRISAMLTEAEKEELVKEASQASSWVYEVISEICES